MTFSASGRTTDRAKATLPGPLPGRVFGGNPRCESGKSSVKHDRAKELDKAERVQMQIINLV